MWVDRDWQGHMKANICKHRMQSTYNETWGRTCALPSCMTQESAKMVAPSLEVDVPSMNHHMCNSNSFISRSCARLSCSVEIWVCWRNYLMKIFRIQENIQKTSSDLWAKLSAVMLMVMLTLAISIAFSCRWLSWVHDTAHICVGLLCSFQGVQNHFLLGDARNTCPSHTQQDLSCKRSSGSWWRERRHQYSVSLWWTSDVSSTKSCWSTIEVYTLVDEWSAEATVGWV